MDALVHPCCESLWSIEIHKSYLYLNPSLNLKNNLATCQLRISIVRTRLLKKVAPAAPKLSKKGLLVGLGPQFAVIIERGGLAVTWPRDPLTDRGSK